MTTKVKITVKEVWSYIKGVATPFPIGLGLMISTATTWAVSISLLPYLLKIVVNRLTITLPDQVFISLGGPLLTYIAINFLLSNQYRLYDYFVTIRMIPIMRRNILNQSIDLLLGKSHAYYQNKFSGSLTNKVNDLMNSVPEFIQIFIDRFFSHLLALFIAIVTLGLVHPIFALFMGVFTVGFTLGAFWFSPRLTHLADQWSEEKSTLIGKIVDILSNILSVRLFVTKGYEKQILGHTVQKAVDAEQKLEWHYFYLWLIYGLCALFTHIFSFYFLCKGYKEGWITVGDFVLVVGINNTIFDFLWQLAKDFSQFSSLYGKITQALRDILDSPQSLEPSKAQLFRLHEGRICFEKVNFHYKNSPPLFTNLSIIIEPGQKVGLVGYSGSGKTTFVNLILRLYDINSGRIMIDEQDISQISLESLRSSIAMIPQDPSLFHPSLWENIHYGRIEASEDDILKASQKAHTHDFITKLEKGYESMVGERGIKLSGGQRQRVALARAILKNAPILILDEATSQLDSLTEKYIQESLWELMEGKTTLIIAHRLSTLLHMDRILVFNDGKIVEDGSHTSLLKKNGLYKTLWEAQVGEFLGDQGEIIV